MRRFGGFMVVDPVWRFLALRAGEIGERMNLACPLPARHQVLVDCMNSQATRPPLPVPKFEDRVAADDFLASTNGPSTTLSFPSVIAHLRASGKRHQAATVDHVARLEFAVGKRSSRPEAPCGRAE